MEVVNFTSMPSPFFQTPGGAATISAGASILSNAFGSGSSGMSTQRSQARKLRMQAYKQDRRHYEKMYLSHVKGAKAAGLHPLFALGSGGGGSSPGIAIPGQSERGSAASDAVQAAQSAYQQHSLYDKQKDLIDAQAELARARALEQVVSNDNADELPTSPLNKGNPHVVVEPARVTASADGGTTAEGVNPAYGQFQFGRFKNGDPIVIKGLGTEVTEMFEPQNIPAVVANRDNQRTAIRLYRERVWDKLPLTRASKFLMDWGRNLVQQPTKRKKSATSGRKGKR